MEGEERKPGTGTDGSPRGTTGLGKRRDVCCGRAGGVRAARVSRSLPAEGYFACGLAADAGFGCCALPWVAAASAAFASAPLGAVWWTLSPPFAMVLTPFR